MSVSAARTAPFGGARWRGLLVPLGPLLAAFAVAALVLLFAGHDPLEVYWLLATESFGGSRRIAATLSAATPLILTGLATAVAFRAGAFNVGVEGCIFVGGLAAAYVGFTFVGLPAFLLLPLALLAAVIVGSLWMLVPGLLKARLDVDEVVTTLMLNFIAIVLLGLYALWGNRTALGFETRIAGMNARFASASGINVPMLVIKMMLLSGAIGGLAGGIHALGNVGRFVAGFSPGYGFTGIAVALLGRGSALGIFLAALLFGALANAGATIQLFSDVPIEIVDILQGTVMIFAVAQLGWLFARRRRAAA